jgi:hypothetical protein
MLASIQMLRWSSLSGLVSRPEDQKTGVRPGFGITPGAIGVARLASRLHSGARAPPVGSPIAFETLGLPAAGSVDCRSCSGSVMVH